MKILVVLFSMFLLSACGLKGAIDATQEVPKKMDETNLKIDKTNEQMADTQEAIRLQKLGIAKQNLEDPENARTMQPLPTGMMGYAKLFAETATAEELLGQIYLYITEVNKGVFPSQVDVNNQPIPLTPQNILDVNLYKTQRYVAAQAISAFIPAETINEIVQSEIIEQGRYKATALNILMMRFTFTSQVLLDKSLLDDELTSVGMVEKALEYVENLETIANYPFADQVSLKIFGFTGQPPIQADLKQASEQIASRLETMDFQISMNLETVDMSQLDNDPVVNEKAQQQSAKRLNVATQKVAEKLAYWQSRTP